MLDLSGRHTDSGKFPESGKKELGHNASRFGCIRNDDQPQKVNFGANTRGGTFGFYSGIQKVCLASASGRDEAFTDKNYQGFNGAELLVCLMLTVAKSCVWKWKSCWASLNSCVCEPGALSSV